MQTDKWTHQIDENTKAFNEAFIKLTGAQLNWKPNPQTWSIAQNIDHLIVINETFFPVIHAIRQGTYSLPFVAKLGFMANFLGKTILNAVEPTRSKKMKTLPVWEPSKSEIKDDILYRFEKHQSALKNMIAGCQDLLDKGTIISSPGDRKIVYKLDTAFDIIVTHEQRHLGQAKEVMREMK
jgi:hypothetical protein